MSFRSQLTGLVVGVATGSLAVVTLRQQIWFASEFVSNQFDALSMNKPQEHGPLIPNVAPRASQVLPVHRVDTEQLVDSAKSDLVHRWNAGVRAAHAYIVKTCF